jgi:hypothetical protein
MECLAASATVEGLNVAAALISALATVALAVAAFIGLFAWRRQLSGTANYDLTRRILLDVYKFRDSLQAIRVSILFDYEFAERPGRNPGIPDRAADYRYLYEKRLERLAEASRSLETSLREAEVLWGPQILALPRDQLDSIATQLQFAVGMFCDSVAANPHWFTNIPAEIAMKKGNPIVFRVPTPDGAPDEYTVRLKKIVANFESALSHHLGRKIN